MLSIEKYGLNSSSFNFSFTTSSGDKIDLKMFDSIEATSNFNKSNGYVSEEFTLKHQYGYEFHYEGNGLDKRDLEELKEALKKVKPLLKKFLAQKENNEKIMNNMSHYFKSLLPEPKNNNHLNFIKEESIKTFDDVLKEIKAGMEELKKAKELFDKLFDNSNKLDIFV